MASQTPVKPDLDLRRQTTFPQLNSIAYQGKKQALLTATNPTAFFLSLKPQSTRQKPSKPGTIKQHWAGSVGTRCTRVKHTLNIPSSGNYLPKHLPNSQRNCRKTLVRTTRVANKMFVQLWTYVKICGDNRWNLHGNKKPRIKQSTVVTFCKHGSHAFASIDMSICICICDEPIQSSAQLTRWSFSH